MPVTTGMVGHGFYNRHSAPQMAAIDHVLPWLDEAIESVGLGTRPGNIGLADFGCSEGRNSIAVMQHLVAGLRARTAQPIQTVHSDLVTNDFSELFKALRPEAGAAFPQPEVYSCAVGGSMYDQVLPPCSLHLATTFNAIAFLSRRPLDGLPGYILPNGPSARRGIGQVTDAERAVVEAQALADMQAFLAARAAELVPGGKLLVQVFGSTGAVRTSDGIYDALNDAMLEVLAEGSIDRAGYEAFYQPIWLRTLDELVTPVVGTDAPLFRLDRQETYEAPVPFVDEFRRTGDAARYAHDCTAFSRAFTEPVLRGSFRDLPALDRVIGDIYERAERLIGADPDRYEFHYIAVAALMTRCGG